MHSFKNHNLFDCAGPVTTFRAPRLLTAKEEEVVITYAEHPHRFSFRLARSPEFEQTPLLDQFYQKEENRNYRIPECCVRKGQICAALVFK